jgi:type IX secretion system PorP/SprF family membrane protein
MGAYHLRTSAGVLSSGIGLGFINTSFSPDWIPPMTMEDPFLPSALSETGFDVNVGLHWQSTNIPYFVGLSITHAAPPTFNAVNYAVARHYYALAGFNYKLNAMRSIILKPTILVKADGATAIFDLNVTANVWMTNTSYVWAGITYRIIDAVAINAGYAFSPSANQKINMMKIGYSFDIMTNALSPFGRGSHELMINFCFIPPPSAVSRHGNPFILE